MKTEIEGEYGQEQYEVATVTQTKGDLIEGVYKVW